MCGRYYIDEAVEKDIERLVREIDKNMKRQRTGDIHPIETAPVICKREKELYAVDMKWGFEGKDKKPLINARAESALEKPTFSDSVKHRRCIIPARSFYEWNREKQKVTFRYEKSPSIYMAGFYRMYGNDPHFIILTTVANDSMRPVHDRMPLILDEQEIMTWIYEDDNTNLVVADASRTEKTICLAVSPSLKTYGILGRARLFEVVQRVKEVNRERIELSYIIAPPRLAFYMQYSTIIYNIFLTNLSVMPERYSGFNSCIAM